MLHLKSSLQYSLSIVALLCWHTRLFPHILEKAHYKSAQFSFPLFIAACSAYRLYNVVYSKGAASKNKIDNKTETLKTQWQDVLISTSALALALYNISNVQYIYLNLYYRYKDILFCTFGIIWEQLLLQHIIPDRVEIAQMKKAEHYKNLFTQTPYKSTLLLAGHAAIMLYDISIFGRWEIIFLGWDAWCIGVLCVG